MSFLAFRRGVTGARLLVEYGHEKGLDRPSLLAGSGIAEALLADPDAELEPAQELQVARNLSRLLGHPPGLGLELGLRYRLGNFGMWGYGLLSSATAGAALQAAMRFLPLSYAFSTISTRVLEDSVEVHFGEPDLAPGLGRLLVERDLAAAAMLMRQVAGDGFRLDRIALKALPGRIGVPPAGIHDILGAVPDFKAGEYLIAYDRAYLARPLPQADPATAAMCERMCQKLMEQRRVDIGCTAMVRHQLAALPPGALPSLHHIAGLLHTSERTLKRRLQGEGTSFRQLVAQSQAASAAALVGEHRLSLTEVAERMGYADLSAFSQAFKRWHGVSPEGFRRTCRTG
ncbi:AraC family transcriptional regulator [Paracidovorax avenae]|uniref:AraC family transcriptional regulator n=1 Tax=Paracidovorax avenae TaxID=80867 RepID=UPI000D16E5D6|nr:AraC family transcriptional regulator [Paracidovorax avenae]AVS70226.1 AraC family transcriptional regulator [Paracidovorax avenae]